MGFFALVWMLLAHKQKQQRLGPPSALDDLAEKLRSDVPAIAWQWMPSMLILSIVRT